MTDQDKLEMQEILERTLASKEKKYKGDDILLTEYFESWLESKRKVDISQKTYENYEGRYRNYIKPFFMGKAMTAVTVERVDAFVERLLSCGISKSMILDIVRVLSIACNDAVRRDLICKNPCDCARLPRIKKKSTRPAITPEEVVALYKAAEGHRHQISIPLLFETGMRKGELLALQWDDLYQNDAEQWFLHINKEVSSSKVNIIEYHTKTENSCRDVAISDSLADLLLKYKASIKGTVPTFIISQKRADKWVSATNFQKEFSRWRKSAGIRKNVTIHSFRHLFATMAVKANLPVEGVTKQAGWASGRMIEYYTDSEQTTSLKSQCADAIGEQTQSIFC